MNNTLPVRKKEYLSLLALPIYLLCCFALFGIFKTIIDPDDTNYLTIAERYASGDWRLAINGMWSPLNSWIGALFLPFGMKAIYLFKYLNFAFGSVVVLSVRSLLQKSELPRKFHFIFLLGLMPFFIYATYNELGVDWLQCMVLLLYINVIFSKKYTSSYLYPLLCGILGALAYYAKYYNFHFFWLHFSIANFFWFYSFDTKKLDKRFWKFTGTGILLLLVLSVPWILLLHQKYDLWGLNYTGVFDLAWSLDHNILVDHTKALLQPGLPHSPSFLEDPIWLPHHFVSPFTSLHFFRRQIFISMLSIVDFFDVLYEYSALILPVWAYYLFVFFKGGYRKMSFETAAILVFITMPAGYFLFHFEARFLWPVCVLGYLLGLKLVTEIAWVAVKKNILKWAMAGFVIITFWVKPGMQIFKCWFRDKEVNEWAEQLKPYHLENKTFITNSDQNKLIRFAYLTHSSLYVYSIWDVKIPALIEDMTERKVDYYLEFTSGMPLFSCDYMQQRYPEITNGALPFVKIYKLH